MTTNIYTHAYLKIDVNREIPMFCVKYVRILVSVTTTTTARTDKLADTDSLLAVWTLNKERLFSSATRMNILQI